MPATNSGMLIGLARHGCPWICRPDLASAFVTRAVRNTTGVLCNVGSDSIYLELPRLNSTFPRRYFKLPANSANRPFLDLSVTRHAGDFAACRVEPDGMSATLAVEDAAVLPEMSLQIRQPHVPANSIVSRKASGESSFSASSRWHSRTSFKASRRFALASSTVSPCEIAAGISSTKQVYPPSLAGSKTAVSFMLTNYHAQRSVQQVATFSFNSQNQSIKPISFALNTITTLTLGAYESPLQS